MAMANNKISNLSLQHRADLIKGAMLAAGTAEQDEKEAAVIEQFGKTVAVGFDEAMAQNGEPPEELSSAINTLKQTIFRSGIVKLTVEAQSQFVGIALPLYFSNHVIAPAMETLSSVPLEEARLDEIIAMQRSMQFSMAQSLGKNRMLAYAASRHIKKPWSYKSLFKSYPVFSMAISGFIAMMKRSGSGNDEIVRKVESIDRNNETDDEGVFHDMARELEAFTLHQWNNLLCKTLLAAQAYTPQKLSLSEMLKDMNKYEQEDFLLHFYKYDMTANQRLVLMQQLREDLKDQSDTSFVKQKVDLFLRFESLKEAGSPGLIALVRGLDKPVLQTLMAQWDHHPLSDEDRKKMAKGFLDAMQQSKTQPERSVRQALSHLAQQGWVDEQDVKQAMRSLVDGPEPSTLDAEFIAFIEVMGWLEPEDYSKAINKVVMTKDGESSQLTDDIQGEYYQTITKLSSQLGVLSKQALYDNLRDTPSMRGLTALSRVTKAAPTIMGTVFIDADTQQRVVGTMPPIDPVEDVFFDADGVIQSKAMIQVSPRYAMCSSLQALYVVITDAEKALSEDGVDLSSEALHYVSALNQRINAAALPSEQPNKPGLPDGFSMDQLKDLVDDRELRRALKGHEGNPNKYESLSDGQVTGWASLAVRCRIEANKIQQILADNAGADSVTVHQRTLSREQAQQWANYLTQQADHIEYQQTQQIKEVNASLGERLGAYREKLQAKEAKSKADLQSTDGVAAWQAALGSFEVGEPADEGVGLAKLEETRKKLEYLKGAKATRLERKSKGFWKRTWSQADPLHQESTVAKGTIRSFALDAEDTAVLESLGHNKTVVSLVAGKNIRDLAALKTEQDVLGEAIRAIQTKIQAIEAAQAKHKKRQDLAGELATFEGVKDAQGVMAAYDRADDLLGAGEWDGVEGKEQLLVDLQAARDEAAKGQVGVLASAFEGVGDDPNPIARCDQLIQAIAKARPLAGDDEKTQLEALAVKVQQEKCERLLDAIPIPDEKPVVNPLPDGLNQLIDRLSKLKSHKESLTSSILSKQERAQLEGGVKSFQLTDQERDLISSVAGEDSQAVLAVIDNKGVGARQRGWFRRQSSSGSLSEDVDILNGVIESLGAKVRAHHGAQAGADKAGKAHQALTEGLAAARTQMKGSTSVSDVMACYQQSIKLLESAGVDGADLEALKKSLRDLRQAPRTTGGACLPSAVVGNHHRGDLDTHQP